MYSRQCASERGFQGKPEAGLIRAHRRNNIGVSVCRPFFLATGSSAAARGRGVLIDYAVAVSSARARGRAEGVVTTTPGRCVRQPRCYCFAAKANQDPLPSKKKSTRDFFPSCPSLLYEQGKKKAGRRTGGFHSRPSKMEFTRCHTMQERSKCACEMPPPTTTQYTNHALHESATKESGICCCDLTPCLFPGSGGAVSAHGW